MDLNVTLERLVEERPVGGCEAVVADELGEIIARFQPDVVGISALFNSSSSSIQALAAAACRRRPSGSCWSIARTRTPSARAKASCRSRI